MMPHTMRKILIAVLILFLLVACSEPATQPLPPTPTPLAFTSLGDLLAAPQPGPVRTVGYVLVDGAGARLLPDLSFSAGTAPVPLGPTTEHIWLGADPGLVPQNILTTEGGARYAPVAASGRIEGPANYGPGGVYRYQLVDPNLTLLVPQETSITALLDPQAGYEGRFVRVVGALLAREDTALLVDQLGPGGLPSSKAQQVKIRGPLRDHALLERLGGTPGGAVRFGTIQIEGIWRGGILLPLSIRLVM